MDNTKTELGQGDYILCLNFEIVFIANPLVRKDSLRIILLQRLKFETRSYIMSSAAPLREQLHTKKEYF